MSDLLDRLKARLWRMTPQRRVVAEVLDGEHVHLSADEVHRLAQQRLPEISLATVYNTLNELVAMRELIEISCRAGPRRYDPNTATPHQHLLCVSCGQLRDVQPTGQAALRLPPKQRYGFAVHDVDIVFNGLCPVCRSGAGTP